MVLPKFLHTAHKAFWTWPVSGLGLPPAVLPLVLVTSAVLTPGVPRAGAPSASHLQALPAVLLLLRPLPPVGQANSGTCPAFLLSGHAAPASRTAVAVEVPMCR